MHPQFFPEVPRAAPCPWPRAPPTPRPARLRPGPYHRTPPPSTPLETPRARSALAWPGFVGMSAFVCPPAFVGPRRSLQRPRGLRTRRVSESLNSRRKSLLGPVSIVIKKRRSVFRANNQTRRSPLLLKLTELPLVLWSVALSTFVSVGSALGGRRNQPKGLRSRQHGRVGSTP